MAEENTAANSVKLGAETMRLTAVLAVVEPEVPVTITLYWPRLAVLLAVRVRMLEPELVETGLGRRMRSPRWAGRSGRLTLPVNPYCGVT